MPGKGGWPKAPPLLSATKMRVAMSNIDLDELRSELDDFAEPKKKGGRSPREERIVAGFEEIQRFAQVATIPLAHRATDLARVHDANLWFSPKMGLWSNIATVAHGRCDDGPNFRTRP